MMSCSLLFGQQITGNNYNWEEPSNCRNTMMMFANLTIDGVDNYENYEIGAFCGNELRGKVRLESGGTIFLTIGGEKDETISFKLYDHSQDAELNGVYENVTFVGNGHIGNGTPVEISANFVASSNSINYLVLQDAINAAQNNGVVTLLADCAENVTVVQAPDVAFTIDGADKNYTGTITVNGKSAAYATAGLTIKNVNFDATNIAKDASINLGGSDNTRYTSNVTVEGCTFTGKGQAKAAIKNYTGGCKNLTVTGCEAEGLHSLVQVKGVAGLTIDDVTVKNCKNGIGVGTSTNVNISNSTIAATGYGVRADASVVSTTTIKDCNITANIPVVLREATSENYNLVVDGENAMLQTNNDGYWCVIAKEEYPDVAIENLTIAQGNIAVELKDANLSYDGVYGNFAVAKIGTKQFTTLAAAVDAAQANDHIVLIDNVKEDVTINKNVTIDGADFTYTGQMQMTNRADITVKNVNFDGKNLYNYAIETRGAYYLTIEGCIAKNYIYGFVQTASGTVRTTVKNVTVSDCNYGVKVDYSNEVVLENVNLDCAVAAVLNSNYGEKTITIKNSELNILGTWKRNTGLKTTYVFEGANEVGEFIIEAELDNFKLAAEATLKAPEGLNVTTDVEGHVVEYKDGVYSVEGNIYNVTKEKYYKTFDEAYSAATTGDVIQLNKTVIIDGSNMWTNYSKKNITVKANFGDAAFRVQSGNSMVWFGGMTIESDDYCIIVGASDGSVEASVDIYGGTYKGVTSAISVTKGNVNILGGTFYVEPYEGSYDYTINCIDANYKNGDADVSIKGGKFYNFDPQDNAAEGAGTNFLVARYATVKDSEGYWEVVPAAAYIKDGKYYAIINDAIAAAQAGDEVLILEGTYTQDLTINKDITVSGESNNAGDIRVTLNGKLNITADGATAKNLNVNNGSNTAGYINAKDVLVEACNVTGGNGFRYCYTTGTVTFKDSKITGSTYGIHFDGSANGNIVIDNCEIVGWTSFASTITNVAITGTTFSEGNYNQLRFYQNAQLTDCTFPAEMTIDFGKDDVDADFTSCTVTGDAPLTDVIYLGDIVEMGVDVTIDDEPVVVEAKVANADGKNASYYLELEDAINAAAENQVVTVCADVELENTITVAADKVVTLDLNGKVVSGVSATAGASAVITNKGNLTVKSSVEGGKVTSQALTPDTEWGGEGQPSFPSYANNTVRNEGTLTLVSGTIENTSAAGGATYAIDNYAGSTTNINGGVVYCENNFAIRLFSNGDINMNVTGGTITGTRAIWMQLPSGANSTAKPDVNLNITGGTLTSIDEEYNLAVYVYSYGQSAENVNLSISGENTVINGNVAVYEPTVTMKENSVQVSGGTFNGEYGVYSYADTEDAAPVISITGGTFATNYSEQYAEDDNFIFVQNAEGTYTVTEGAYVAQIGETRYSSLAAAVTAATSGQTVTLLRDVNESVTITGKTLTLDGGNYNYTGMFTTTGSSSNYTYTFRNFNIDGGDGIYFVKSNGSNVNFVIENCTVKNKDYGFFYGNKSFNKLTVNKVTIDNCPYVARITSGGNSLTFNEVKVTNSTNGIYIKNTTKRNFEFTNCDIDTKITVDGGTSMTTFKFDGENTVATLSASQYAKYVLAAADATLTAPEGYDVTTTVEGCTVKYVDGAYKVIPAVAAIGDVVYGSIQEAINAAQDDDVIVVLKDINLNEITLNVIDNSYDTYFKVEGKTVTIDLNGKKISGEYAQAVKTMLVGVFSTDNNGHLTLVDNSEEKTAELNLTGTAKVYSLITNYEPGCSITINGGTYILDKASDNLIYSGADAGENEGVTVNGGVFQLGNVGTGQNGKPWIFNCLDSNERNVIVNGGTFNADINHQYWAHEVNVPETLALKDNGNGTWTVVPAEAYVKEYFASSNYKYSRNVGYATLEEALAVAMEKDFTDVVLVADITTEASYSIAAGETVVLDLNGKTITGTDNTTKNFGLIQNNGTLTVNATNGGMMTVVATTNSGWNRYSAVISNNPGATLTVNGGTIEHLGGTDMAYGIDALTNGGIGDVNTTINGGTIKSTYRAVRQFLNSDSKENNLTVNGGTLEGTNKSIFFHDPSKKANNGKVTVSTDAKLVGDVYLYVTEGSTEWPVEVSIAKDAFTSGTVLSANVPASYSVETVDGFWTVLDVQSQELSQGWNWYSTYLNYDLAKLQTALGADGKQIEAQTSYCKYQSGNWFGSMQSVSVKEMYKIEVAEDVTLNISGELADFNESIDIKTGFNWIGYPFNKAVAIDEALSSFTPAAGDYVMAQKSFAVYYQGIWQGTLKQMTPGQGYIYERVGENTTLNYTVESVRGIAEDNITADNNYWVPDARMYPNNMAVIAVLEGAMNENYEVAAFVNGEVRGSARPIYIDALDSYMFFMTIHGEGVEEMTFKCYDLNTNTEYDLNNVINYSDNAFLGSIDKPYVLTRGTTGVGETLSSNFNIYPNPTTTDSEINLNATFDKVEVFNALGVKVIEYQNVDSIDALETAGIYVIRVTNNGEARNCRLVVK